jgi:hypothetical protein
MTDFNLVRASFLCLVLFALPVFGQDTFTTTRSLFERFPLSARENEVENVYEVAPTVTLSEIEQQTKLVRAWISLPGEDKNQRLLDLDVEACPGEWKIVEDQQRRGQFLYSEVSNPDSSTLDFLGEILGPTYT